MDNIVTYQGYVIRSFNGYITGFISNEDTLGLKLTTEIIHAKIFKKYDSAKKFTENSIFKNNVFSIIPFYCEFKY